MGIPVLIVVANNRVYFNDVAHQETMAKQRARPVENKFFWQEMSYPPVDLVGLARAQGVEGEGPLETSGELAAALLRGEAIVRAGRPYVIDARVDVGAPGEAHRGHTSGRRE